ncbi:MAG: carboxylate-amine ligase [Acidimicrobiia bacterium]|nr:carboxylate-amine ligase [Acidimicrobiia bacterium]MDH3397768.1 carboxylate-amine ligase [Acidimicrobiia bacterium]MDH5616552.1 carboxylate-amine ligase [Acidimicrobiia bacterium]
MPKPEFTIGIEEEYLLVDRVTRNLVQDPPDSVMKEARQQLDAQVGHEFLRSQIEVGTRICSTVQEAREDLARLRKVVAEVADHHGFALIAASTHPFAEWGDQLTTDNERYHVLAQDLQTVVRRLVICGMHVHVGIGDNDLRIDLMNQISYFVPHLLALSGSSPFWHGRNTGLKSYRMSVFKALPRTGLPEVFSSWSEYRRHVDVLVEAGLIEDATKLWWDVRPSERYPTLEMRISDVCTTIDDGITVAALYLSLLHMLYGTRRLNQRWRTYADMLVEENVWRAQRYGIEGSLMDFGIGELIPYPELIEELIELVHKDADELGCVAEVEHARGIVARGTSADRQIRVHREALEAGADEQEALRAVVDLLMADSVAGL